jgi:simple sugar transport system substrate-binding protein
MNRGFSSLDEKLLPGSARMGIGAHLPTGYLLVVSFLMVFLIACDNRPQSYTISTVVKMANLKWFARMERGVDRFEEETGHKTFLIGPPRADAALQVHILERLIDQQVDAITVVPFSPETLEPILRKAMDRGIIVITHEASNQENRHYDLEAFDNSEYGSHLMDNLATCMGYEGEYAVFVGNLSSRSHNEWVDSAVARQREKYPKMRLMGARNESYDEESKAYELTYGLFESYPNLNGFLGSTALDVVGIGRAVEELGLEEKTCVFGTSLPSLARNYLESGAVDMISFWDPANAGFAMDLVALKVLQGEEIRSGDNLGVAGYENVKVKESVIYGNAIIDVTRDNVDAYPF